MASIDTTSGWRRLQISGQDSVSTLIITIADFQNKTGVYPISTTTGAFYSYHGVTFLSSGYIDVVKVTSNNVQGTFKFYSGNTLLITNGVFNLSF